MYIYIYINNRCCFPLGCNSKKVQHEVMLKLLNPRNGAVAVGWIATDFIHNCLGYMVCMVLVGGDWNIRILWGY